MKFKNVMLELKGKWMISLLTLDKNHIFFWDTEKDLYNELNNKDTKYDEFEFFDVTSKIGNEFPDGGKIRRFAEESCRNSDLKEIIVGWQITAKEDDVQEA